MMTRYTYWFPVLFTAVLASLSYDKLGGFSATVPCETPATVSYSLSVSPLLDRHCRRCHNAKLFLGGTDLEDFSELKRRAKTGKLLGVVSHAPGFPQMPKDSAKLSDCDIALLKQWVDAGAPNN